MGYEQRLPQAWKKINELTEKNKTKADLTGANFSGAVNFPSRSAITKVGDSALVTLGEYGLLGETSNATILRRKENHMTMYDNKTILNQPLVVQGSDILKSRLEKYVYRKHIQFEGTSPTVGVNAVTVTIIGGTGSSAYFDLEIQGGWSHTNLTGVTKISMSYIQSGSDGHIQQQSRKVFSNTMASNYFEITPFYMKDGKMKFDIRYSGASNRVNFLIIPFDNFQMSEITFSEPFRYTGTITPNLFKENISKNSNGYMKFEDGLIIQWGYGVSVRTTSTIINFPIAFSGAHHINISADNSESRFIINQSASHTNFEVRHLETSVWTSWIAIGY